MTPTKKMTDVPRCGLCGKTGNLIKTECCGNWICDDEHEYVPFSYARNSCSRNHRRYTLCGHHFAEGHRGKWQTCPECRSDFEPEMVAWYGTNEYNFEKMPDPPSYEPTRCSRCSVIIKLGTDGYTISGDEYWCEKCADTEMRKRLRQTGV
ncbi:MAG: hypothetical protein JXA28_11500 [Bacteroidetes bacterium]|nr:hypothetical protein [Bacteroidota bacterium]